MKRVDVTLSERELKFLIDLMWGAPIATVKQTAGRHGIDDKDLEGHLAKCLGYLYLETDGPYTTKVVKGTTHASDLRRHHRPPTPPLHSQEY